MAVPDTDSFVYQGQGFELVLTTGIDLTNEAGNVRLLIKKPDGAETQVTPDILSPETAGQVQYAFATDELDQTGDWYIKTYLVEQQTPGRTYVLTVLGEWEKAGVPSVTEIRQYIEGYCATEEELSNLWISQRRDMVVKWLEYKTALPIGREKQFTEYVSGTGSSVIWVSRKPIASLDKLEYTVAPGDFAPNLSAVEVDLETGVLKARDNFEEAKHPIFPKGRWNIRVTYTAGSTVIPEELYEAILALTAEKVLGMLASKHGGGTSISVGGYSRTYGSRGKYTEARNELARWGVDLAKKYMSGVVAG